MTVSYLSKHSSISEACTWLEIETKMDWSLKKLLEHGVMPWFWLDFKHGLPNMIFEGRIEGYLAPVVFASDVDRIAADGSEALVNMTRTYSGEMFKIDPPIRFSVDELRFLRDDIKDLVTLQNDAISTYNDSPTQSIICSSYIPSNAIGKIVIKAAIIIEESSKKRATNKEVMILLKEWAGNGSEPSYLIKYDDKNKNIIWNTEKSSEAKYTHEACSRTLTRWNKGRH